jgi:hypothetical protein
MREAEAAHVHTTRWRVLLHQSVWHARHTEDCHHFAEIDDAFNAVGDGYEKVPLSLMCNEKKVLLPGYRSSAPSVHAYVAAVAKVSQMARHVHVTAKESDARVLEFLQSLEDNEPVPENVVGVSLI